MMRNITYVGWGLGFWQTVSGDIRHDSRSVISEKQPVKYLHLYIHMCIYIYVYTYAMWEFINIIGSPVSCSLSLLRVP